MYKWVLILLIFFVSKPVNSSESQRINIYIDRNIVCIDSVNKCWPFAKGSKEYPTPIWEGGRHLLIHKKDGFVWRNPFTGQVYNKGTHSLGDIWIQFYEDTNYQYGFHKTPYPNTPLHLQTSHGCLRMTEEDIKEFSSLVNYFDMFYIIKN